MVVSSSTSVPKYEWVGNQLMQNSYRSAYRSGESPYTRDYAQAVATRGAGGVSWNFMPNTETMAAAGVDPSATFKYGGQDYQISGGRAVAVNAAGQPYNPQTLMTQWQSAYDEAKRANEDRYQQILTGLEGMGDQAKKDIGTTYRAAASQGQQDLITRGLGGTTMLPSMRLGVANQEAAAQARLEEQLSTQKFGFMERRTDTYPDITPYLNLLTQYGNATGAAGLGGGVSYAARQPLTTRSAYRTPSNYYGYGNAFGSPASF